jgi:hypothetical protein
MEIRPLTAADPVPIAQAFSALGWPGKTVDQYRRYLERAPRFRRRRIASTLMDAAEDLVVARSDTAGIGVGLYADSRDVGRADDAISEGTGMVRHRPLRFPSSAVTRAVGALLTTVAMTAGVLLTAAGPAQAEPWPVTDSFETTRETDGRSG